MNAKHGEIWHFEPFIFYPAAFELIRDGEVVSIEPQSLRLLEYLIRHRDRVVSREDLIGEIWQGRAISDWAVSGAIKALRSALGDNTKDKQFVRTVHSRGYRFVADITTQGSGATGNIAAERPTVLVRLFRAPSDAAGTAYLADGLTEDLITGLSRHRDFRVLSYNTSRAFADAEPPKSAGISNIVDGSVRQMDDTIRINVAVLDGTGTHQIWAERFDLTRASLLAGHDRIGDRLADVLSPGRSVTAPMQHGTRNPDAYDHYLKGRYTYFKYKPAAFSEALAHFAHATELDPAFADAFAQQAYCQTTLYVFGLPGADQTLDTAETLARKAIQLDDRSALGYARLGWVLGYRGQPDATTAAFEEAIARDPDSAEVYHAYGETMNRLAQPKRAEQLLQTAFSKDSYFPPSWEFPRGHSKILLGEHDSAITHFRSVLERVDRFIPARVQLARAYWEVGDYRSATEMVAKIKSIAPKYGLAHAGRMFPYPVARERARLIDALAGAGMG